MSESVRKVREGLGISLEEEEFFRKRLQKFNLDQFVFFLAVWHGYVDFSNSEGAHQKFSFRGKSQYPIEKINHLLRIKDVQAWPIQFDGEFSIKNQVQKVKDICKGDNKDDDDRRNYALDQGRYEVARIFGLDVGGGMKLYRQAFVQELLLLPQEEGEALWRTVNDSVRIRERNNVVPEHMEKQFPKTLQEAARYYGV